MFSSINYFIINKLLFLFLKNSYSQPFLFASFLFQLLPHCFQKPFSQSITRQFSIKFNFFSSPVSSRLTQVSHIPMAILSSYKELNIPHQKKILWSNCLIHFINKSLDCIQLKPLFKSIFVLNFNEQSV